MYSLLRSVVFYTVYMFTYVYRDAVTLGGGWMLCLAVLNDAQRKQYFNHFRPALFFMNKF